MGRGVGHPSHLTLYGLHVFCLSDHVLLIQVEKVLKKEASKRTPVDLQLLEHSQDIVDEIEKRAKKRDIKKQRTLEVCVQEGYAVP
jgi:hypothetical protein